MAHAKQADLKDISHLLESIRTIENIKEKSFGCFYLKSKAVLHFHIQSGRRFAHAFDGEYWNEVDLKQDSSESQQIKYFKSIVELLSSKN